MYTAFLWTASRIFFDLRKQASFSNDSMRTVLKNQMWASKSAIIGLIPQSQIYKFLGYAFTQIANPQIYNINLCSATCRSATLPLIMPNGSESHPPFCLSPGTAHQRCDSEYERFNVHTVYSVNICRQS
jgi:hypothetical protein